MKHGPFVMLTSTPNPLGDDVQGVYELAHFDVGMLASVKAVLLDSRLTEQELARIQADCLQAEVPFFFFDCTVCMAPDYRQAYQRLASQFLFDQNAWVNRPPSAETYDRIELNALVDIITTANSLLEPEEVMHTVMTRIHKIIPCGAWSVLILENNESRNLYFAAAYGPGSDGLKQLKVPFGQGIAGWVAEHCKPIIVNDARTDPRFMSQIDQSTQFVTKNILCAPLVSRGRTIGVIEMLNRDDGFTDSDLELLQTMVNPAAVAIENAYLFQKAQELTIRDDLTQLYNSRHLNACLDDELARSQRYGHPLGLIFLDLDGFKNVNDTFGHLQGSQCLIDVAEIIRGCARSTDIVGRYGGDEFVLILPETNTEAAIAVAARIRDTLAAYEPKGLPITASIGIAISPDHGKTKETLIRKADQAMYRVKEKGKNGILLAHEV